MTARPPILSRSLLVAAALCVVAAFALAVLYSPTMRLDRFIATMDVGALLRMQDWVREALGDWAWQNLFVAVLVRPAWLLPLSLAIVLTGLAVSLHGARGLPGSTAKR